MKVSVTFLYNILHIFADISYEGYSGQVPHPALMGK